MTVPHGWTRPPPPLDEGQGAGLWKRLKLYATSGRLSRTLIKLLAVYTIILVSFIALIFLVFVQNVAQRAIVGEMIGAVLIWVVLGGSLTLRYRLKVRAVVLRFPLGWRPKFSLFCIALALLEEAVTTTMTNLAPLFGATPLEAHITASTNYLHVVLFHSVIVFVPWFVLWGFAILRRYDFTPNQIFLVFGLVGTLAEASLNPSSLLGGFWFFIYGLMVYLPAYPLPSREGLRRPGPRHYLLAIVLTILSSAPVAVIVVAVRQGLGIPLFPGT